MTAAVRLTATQTNGGSDNGVTYTDAVNAEIVALWKLISQPLGTVGGTANAVTATSAITGVVSAITAYNAGQKFTIVPTADNTGGVTLNIDSLGVKNVKDSDGNTLAAGDWKSGRRYLIEYDGTDFRILASSGSAAGSLFSTAPGLILRDEKSSGTAAGGFTSGAWQTRTLNTTVLNNISGASLASNQFTLQAGTYVIEFSAPAYAVGPQQTRLQNITDGTTVSHGEGSSEEVGAAIGGQTRSSGLVVVTITSAKVFELQHRCTTTRATDGFGRPGSFGTEVYSVVRVWKEGTLASEVNGIAGGAITFPVLFSTTTADADPGAGTLRLNNATQNTATSIYIDLADANASDITSILDQLNASTSTTVGQLRLVKYDDPTKWLDFNVTLWTTASGYRKLTVNNVASSAASPFANGDRLYFTFSRTGDRGASGGWRYLFATSTSMADPSAGNVRLNNATFASVTQIAISYNNAESGNPSMGATILSWDDSTNAAKGILRLYKQSAPQNFIDFQINAAVTDNTTWVQIPVTYIIGAGSFSASDVLAAEFYRSGDIGSSFTAATQADMEAGTDLTKGVTAGRIQFAPSSAKAWAMNQNTTTITAGYNIASITDTGAGDWTYNFTTSFSSANFCATGTVYDTSGSANADSVLVRALATGGSVRMNVRDNTGTLADRTGFMVQCYGDQ